jgi:hypothetical protein
MIYLHHQTTFQVLTSLMTLTHSYKHFLQAQLLDEELIVVETVV